MWRKDALSYGPMSLAVGRGPSVSADPFPAMVMKDMQYGLTMSLTSSAGGAGVYGTGKVFNLNSIYSPEYSGGHQPYGRDQMAAMYHAYKVTDAWVFAEVANRNAQCGYLSALLIPPTDTATLTAQSTSLGYELPNAFTQLVAPYETKLIKLAIPLEKVIGCTRSQLLADIEDYAATVGNSPTVIPRLEVACAADSASITFEVAIRLVYRVQWFKRATLSQS